MTEVTTMAYVYKWVHIPTLSWYVGVRYKQGCSIDDGYICSSKTVKPRILSETGSWSRTIVQTGTPSDMRDLERDILDLFVDRKDARCLNRNKVKAPSGRFTPHTECTRRKMSLAHIGKIVSSETRARMSKSKIGTKRPKDVIDKIVKGLTGRPVSEYTRGLLSKSMKESVSAIAHQAKFSQLRRGRPHTQSQIDAIARFAKDKAKPVLGVSIQSPFSVIYFCSVHEAGRNGFNTGNLRSCILGRGLTCQGYKWRYATDDDVKNYGGNV